jgi:hypothetical protein
VPPANDAVTFAGIGCCVTCRNWPAPVLVVVTPALNVLPLAPAVVSRPDQDPLDVGSVPPNLVVTTMELPLAGTSLALSVVITPGVADVHVNGTHL